MFHHFRLWRTQFVTVNVCEAVTSVFNMNGKNDVCV